MSPGSPVPDLARSASASTAGVHYFSMRLLLHVLSPVMGGSEDEVAVGDPVGDDGGGVGDCVGSIVGAAGALVGAEEPTEVECTVGTGVSDVGAMEGDAVVEYAGLEVGDTVCR